MPKIEIDYSKTVMYKLRHITDINDTEVYIGHTTNFSKRKAQHRINCNCITNDAYNTKKYQIIRSKGGWGEWEMQPIESYPCANKIEACIREEYWRNHYNAQLNALKAHTTEQERKEALKEFAKVYNPVYYQEHKEDEHFIEVRRNYYEANKEHINKNKNIYYHNNKEVILAKQKEHYEVNKEEILAQSKTYRDKNKEKISQYDKERYITTKKAHLTEKITCECGIISCRVSLTRHRKSKKHLDLMEQINKNISLLVE
jgi:hypothetical protein